jgi:uncharacterized RDD family membrane protein YckC
MSTFLTAAVSASSASREAGIGLRVAALLLDLGIAVFGFALLNVVLSKFGVLAPLHSSQHSPLVELWQHSSPWLTLLVATCTLVIVAWTIAAGTPGAMLMGVNVVRNGDGRRVGLIRSALRLLVSVGLGGVGWFGAWRGQRALHDRICGTRTVREDESTRCVADYAALKR